MPATGHTLAFGGAQATTDEHAQQQLRKLKE